MSEEKLLIEYEKLLPGVKKVYVVPLINFQQKKTNYLYLLYKKILEKSVNSSLQIESLSVFSHPKLFFKKIMGEKSLLHYHWFEVQDFQSFLGIFWKIFWIISYKIIGGKIIWTIHNKYPHTDSYFIFNKNVRIYLAKLADKLHVHCESAIEIMTPVLNVDKGKFFIIDHPDYPSEYFHAEQAREIISKKYIDFKIKPGGKIFLMFGAIAKYKGILEVINIFKSSLTEYKLLIAGPVKRWDQGYFNELKKSVEISKNIILIDDFINDEDIPLFFNASDYIIFNFQDILTSGGIYLALSYNKKIIAPSIGCIKDIKNENLLLFNAGKDRIDNLIKILKEIPNY